MSNHGKRFRCDHTISEKTPVVCNGSGLTSSLVLQGSEKSHPVVKLCWECLDILRSGKTIIVHTAGGYDSRSISPSDLRDSWVLDKEQWSDYGFGNPSWWMGPGHKPYSDQFRISVL